MHYYTGRIEKSVITSIMYITCQTFITPALTRIDIGNAYKVKRKPSVKMGNMIILINNHYKVYLLCCVI